MNTRLVELAAQARGMTVEQYSEWRARPRSRASEIREAIRAVELRRERMVAFFNAQADKELARLNAMLAELDDSRPS